MGVQIQRHTGTHTYTQQSYIHFGPPKMIKTLLSPPKQSNIFPDKILGTKISLFKSFIAARRSMVNLIYLLRERK